MRLNPFAPVPFDHPWHEWTHVPSLGRETHSRTWNAAPQPVDAATLVLVPALGESDRWRLSLGRRLGGQFRVIAPDLPGVRRWPFGRRGEADTRTLAGYLVDWMHARRLGRVVLCASAAGADLAGEVAALASGRVARLIVIGSTARVPAVAGVPITVLNDAATPGRRDAERLAGAIASRLRSVPDPSAAESIVPTPATKAVPWWPAIQVDRPAAAARAKPTRLAEATVAGGV